MRAAIAEQAKGFSKGLDIAILAKPSLFELSHIELLSCLGHLMSRI
ncbi:hypothetical protein LEP1GSC058_3226 [Leptospira fainei serovar Hurstbridge str. BUT 6]|uniref:Uncharacterized protein n=1 Tax=Leptospira fainei serovar Hurstbridge str. BUT 6 TaxID=1193011 RepID=S3W088_9LEPT|nr:hypothetical protein LEP1GSC058_3226 [Leptospira fainei serovar Hurstbridge str. BUT 6]